MSRVVNVWSTVMTPQRIPIYSALRELVKLSLRPVTFIQLSAPGAGWAGWRGRWRRSKSRPSKASVGASVGLPVRRPVNWEIGAFPTIFRADRDLNPAMYERLSRLRLMIKTPHLSHSRDGGIYSRCRRPINCERRPLVFRFGADEDVLITSPFVASAVKPFNMTLVYTNNCQSWIITSITHRTLSRNEMKRSLEFHSLDIQLDDGFGNRFYAMVHLATCWLDFRKKQRFSWKLRFFPTKCTNPGFLSQS